MNHRDPSGDTSSKHGRGGGSQGTIRDRRIRIRADAAAGAAEGGAAAAAAAK